MGKRSEKKHEHALEKCITTGSNHSLRSLGRAKARPLTKCYAPRQTAKECGHCLII
ncbi:conserved protein of unknown function [Ectopseudomonas oleovorans]|uniref:Uncharacterized protein n=1 Tax=Ectopseudomonas oleovorans TaxID=301 RepID=A0A653B758_ECTOL|nr:conserved protein of unknown function [Pseudomonas oleovorans]